MKQKTPSVTLLVALFSLFFLALGIVGSMNDILNPFLKRMFSLSYRDAAWVHFSFYVSYFLLSYVSGVLAGRIGSKGVVITGLSLMLLGCQVFHLAAVLNVFWVFLAAVFIIATGVVLLAVMSNTYVTRLGNPLHAPARLNLTNGFSSVGTVIGPLIGNYFILRNMPDQGLPDPGLIHGPYWIYTALLGLLLLWALFVPMPEPDAVTHVSESDGSPSLPLHRYPNLMAGLGAIFAYVGVEIASGSVVVKFLGLPEIAGLSEGDAGLYVSVYWGGTMAGRFLGLLVLPYIAPQRLLGIHAGVALLCVLVVICGAGHLAMWALLLLGLCNSIMFANIFTLSLSGLGSKTQRAAGLLMTAVLGGAVLPVAQGALADLAGLQASFGITFCAYVYILYFALKGYRPRLSTV